MKTLPIHLDLFALVILLGVAQGLFLSAFFLARPGLANRCLGWFTLALVLISTEILLNYTNYTFRLLWTVDLAEPFNFVLGPLFYFYIFSRIRQRLPRYWYWHFVPFVIWLVNAATWIYQPNSFKYNSYLHSQHPELPFIPQQIDWSDDFTGLRHLINEMTLLSCVIYAILALVVIRRARRQAGTRQAFPSLNTLTLLSWIFALVPLLIVLVKSQFRNDVGDYLLATYMAIAIYTKSFLVMRGSDFFRTEVPPISAVTELTTTNPIAATEPRKKYEKSALSGEVEEAVLQKLTRLMNDEKPYLASDLSLPKLAGRLHTTPHHLSQLLNDRLDQNFFDLLATYRIREAQVLLNDQATGNLKIDEIAERVGYNSPSAFHTAFKRLTGQTPAQFRAAATSSRSA